MRKPLQHLRKLALLSATLLLGPILTGEAKAWTTAAAADLRRAAQTIAPAEGLHPRTALLSTLTEAQRSGDAQEIDSIADQLFNALAGDFSSGAVSPGLVDPDWSISVQPGPDLADLHLRLSQGAMPSALLSALLPQTPEYGALRSALAQLRAAPPQKSTPQSRSQILHLRASMERWRWLPRQLPERRLEVWIPQFETVLISGDGLPEMRYPAIVGRARTPTPRFTATISSITLNPTWQPPASIVRELLPGFRADPQRAQREGFEAFDRSGAQIPLAAIDWSAKPFPYRLQQSPGPTNPLGQIRFNLPNPRAIYLHDTSNPGLFGAARRAFSHGCVRVGEPMALGAALLGSPWTREALQAKADQKSTIIIALAHPTPIYFLYFTAHPDKHGQIAYPEDVYSLDKPLVAAMDGAAGQQIATAAPLSCGNPDG